MPQAVGLHIPIPYSCHASHSSRKICLRGFIAASNLIRRDQSQNGSRAQNSHLSGHTRAYPSFEGKSSSRTLLRGSMLVDGRVNAENLGRIWLTSLITCSSNSVPFRQPSSQTGLRQGKAPVGPRASPSAGGACPDLREPAKSSTEG